MNRRISTKNIGLLMLLVLFLASCQKNSLLPSQSHPIGSDIEETDHIVELKYWHTYSDMETEVFEQQVLPLFEQQYPYIKIKAIKVDYSEQLKTNVIAAAMEGNASDMMRVDMIWVPELAKLGVVEPVSQFASFDALKDLFIGSLLETNHYNNKYYGLPVNVNTKMAIFNMKLLREAGLERAPATFAELNIAREKLLAQYPSLSSIGICCTSTWGTLSYFWTFGGELTNDTFTQAKGYLDSEKSRAALLQMKEWYDRGIISETILTGDPGTWDGIMQGDLLMIDEAHWFYTVHTAEEQQQLLIETELAPFPSDAQAGTSIIGGENLVIFSSTKYPKEAWTFIEWMTSEEPQRLMAGTGLLSPIIQGNAQMQLSNDEFVWYSQYVEQLKSARPRPVISSWTQVDDEFARMIERILTGELSVEEATSQSAEKIDRIL